VVTDVELVMNKALEMFLQPALIPARITRRAEEDSPLVVVDTVDLVAELMRKIRTNFGTDESGRAGNKENLGHAKQSYGSGTGTGQDHIGGIR